MLLCSDGSALWLIGARSGLWRHRRPRREVGEAASVVGGRASHDGHPRSYPAPFQRAVDHRLPLARRTRTRPSPALRTAPAQSTRSLHAAQRTAWRDRLCTRWPCRPTVHARSPRHAQVEGAEESVLHDFGPSNHFGVLSMGFENGMLRAITRCKAAHVVFY